MRIDELTVVTVTLLLKEEAERINERIAAYLNSEEDKKLFNWGSSHFLCHAIHGTPHDVSKELTRPYRQWMNASVKPYVESRLGDHETWCGHTAWWDWRGADEWHDAMNQKLMAIDIIIGGLQKGELKL